MLDRHWEILKNFEYKYKERFLSHITKKESLEIFKNLYLFAQKIVGKNYFKRLSPQIRILTKVHSMFMKVK